MMWGRKERMWVPSWDQEQTVLNDSLAPAAGVRQAAMGTGVHGPQVTRAKAVRTRMINV